MKTRIFIVFLFFSSVTFSQNHSIQLLDNNTGEPVSYAYVTYQSLTSKKSNVVVANFEGVAEYNINEKCIITVQSAGYKTYVDTMETGMSHTINIEPDYFNLEQITITGTRTEKQLKDVPVLTHVVTSEQMQAIDATEIQDVLSIAFPNIVISNSSAGNNLNMQGLGADYILFLIDGEKIAGETNGNIDYDRFNAYNIERVEIIKGAASTLYGTNAIGGVVNIITKKPKRKIEGNAGSRYSVVNSSGYNFSELDVNASLGLNLLNKIKTRTDFHMKNNDGFVFNYDPEDKTQRWLINPYSTKSFSQKIIYKPFEKLSINLKGNYYERGREDKYLYPSEFKKDKQYAYGATILYNPNENINISGSWHSDKYQTYYVDQFYDDKETLKYSNRYDNARLITNFKFLQKQLLTIGTEYIYDDLISHRIEDTTRHVNSYVLFLQDDINFSEKFNTVIGFRVDHHSVYGTHFVPKISFMYKLPHINIRANYGHGYKAPTLKELYMNFSPVPIVEIYGNPNLIPETSYYYSASVEFMRKVINSSVSFYQNRLTNKITEVRSPENLKIWNYENINDAVVSGIDLSFKTRIKRNFSVTAAYSYTDSEDKSSGQQIQGTSKNSAHLILSYKKMLKKYKLTVNLQSKYFGKKPYGEVDEDTGEIISKITEAHNLFKITTTHSFFRGIILTVGIDNILDYTQELDITTINPGRTYFAGVNIYIHKLNFKL